MNQLLITVAIVLMTQASAYAELLSHQLKPYHKKMFTVSVPTNMKARTSALESTRIIGNRGYPTRGGRSTTFSYVKNTKNSAHFTVSYSPMVPAFFTSYEKPRTVLSSMIYQIRNDIHDMKRIDDIYSAVSVDERRIKINHVEYHTILVKYSSVKNLQKSLLLFLFTTHKQRIVEIEIYARGENINAAIYNFNTMAEMMKTFELK